MSSNLSPNAPLPGQTPDDGAPNGQTPTPQGQTPTGPQRTPLDSLPVDIQDLVRGLRAEAKGYREQVEAAARAKQQEAEARLAEQGQFKQLADQHAARVKELEPVAERYAELALLVAEQIKEETKDWPATVKALDPGKDAPIEVRRTWRNKARAIVADLQLQARGTSPGNGPNPRPAPPGTRDDAVAQFEKRLRQSGKYGA